MNKFGLFVNPTKKDNTEFKEAIENILHNLNSMNCELILEESSAAAFSSTLNYPLVGMKESELFSWADVILSLGGDGTYLYTARRLIGWQSKGEKRKPILPINCGSLGFLTSIPYTELFSYLPSLLKSEWHLEFRAILNIFVFDKLLCKALNEALLTKAHCTSKVILFSLYLDNNLFTSYLADGMLVATAGGSTGYALSAGGPILEPHLAIMLILPLLPHSIATRPLIIGAERELKIKFSSPGSNCYLIPDGQESYSFEDTTEIKVKLEEKNSWLPILLPPNYNFYNVLQKKLLPKLNRDGGRVKSED